MKAGERMLQQNVEVFGFDVVPDLFGHAEVEALKVGLNETPLQRSRAGARHALRYPVVAKMARDPRLLSIARQVLGATAFPFRATLFDKSPSSNWLVVWHQDTALPLRKRCDLPGWGPWSVKEGVIYAHAPATALEQVLALRVHLDASTEGNGPLRILPRTHTLGVLSDETIDRLASQIDSVSCLVPPGGVVVMRPLAVHASSKSVNEMPRRVLHIEYAASFAIAEGVELALG